MNLDVLNGGWEGSPLRSTKVKSVFSSTLLSYEFTQRGAVSMKYLWDTSEEEALQSKPGPGCSTAKLPPARLTRGLWLLPWSRWWVNGLRIQLWGWEGWEGRSVLKIGK